MILSSAKSILKTPVFIHKFKLQIKSHNNNTIIIPKITLLFCNCQVPWSSGRGPR